MFTNWTASGQAETPLPPSDTGSTSTRLSQLDLLQLTKILSSYYWLD
jgi:hypothetical protein